MAKQVKYFKFQEVQEEDTKVGFIEVGVDVEVIRIKNGYVVLKAPTAAKLQEVITAQDARINVQELTKQEFKDATADAQVIKAIDEAVDARIRQKYTLGEELSMYHKADTVQEKIDFLAYRQEQILIGREQKAELGL